MKDCINRKKVKLILNWCIETFGTNNNINVPTFTLTKQKSIKYCGKYDYDKNHMSFYLFTHKSVKSFCETVIHEYIHYLINNPNYDYNNILAKLDEVYNTNNEIYMNHPHEKICRLMEKLYGEQCFNSLKYKLYN
jgi:hypothetical protein